MARCSAPFSTSGIGGGGENLAILEDRVDEHDTELSSLNAELDQVAAIAATPSGMKSVWRWTDSASPSSGRITTDGASVLVNVTDGDGIDLTNGLSKVTVGSTIYAQARDDSEVYRRWTVSGAPSVATGVYTFPVTIEGGQGTAPSNNTWLVVGFTVPDPV